MTNLSNGVPMPPRSWFFSCSSASWTVSLYQMICQQLHFLLMNEMMHIIVQDVFVCCCISISPKLELSIPNLCNAPVYKTSPFWLVGVKELEWPVQSHLWDELKSWLCFRCLYLTTVPDFTNAFVAELTNPHSHSPNSSGVFLEKGRLL